MTIQRLLALVGSGAVLIGCNTTPAGDGGGGNSAAAGNCPERSTGPFVCDETTGPYECEYLDEACPVRKACNEPDGTHNERFYLSSHTLMTAGGACADPGATCFSSAYFAEGLSDLHTAVCTDFGWRMFSNTCEGCGPCPSSLPTAGETCEPGEGPDDAYSHCGYAVEASCGTLAAGIACDTETSVWVVAEPACP